jgi:hypothetical protein
MEHFKKNPWTPILSILFLFLLIPGMNAAAESTNDPRVQPVADISIGANGIGWTPIVSYHHLELTVSCPDGTVFSKTFDAGTTPYLGLSDNNGKYLVDGSYTYELLAAPQLHNIERGQPDTMGIFKGKPLTQTGYFSVKNGSIVTPASSEAGLAKPMDEVIYDDLIVDGSLCVGNDCYSGLAFGFDTIVLMENNLRIYFDDTSNTSSFPNNDWRIVCNDTTDGGGAYFAIQDVSGGLTPFTIEAGAKSNSLYVDDDGQVGIGTSGPVFELHIKDGDTPAVRIHQSTAYGWPEQIWDVGGNETSFFVRDGTHAARLPFRIEPETPTSTLCLKSDGKVGVGTWSPAYTLEVETTGTGAQIVAQRTDGATMEFSASGSYGIAGTKTNHPVRMRVNDNLIMQINGSGDYLDMIGGGTYDGDWNNGSSREIKDNIRDLDADEAMSAFSDLNPVRFYYKQNRKEEHLGFIAEDVPDLVASNSRKNLSTMDVVAVLTKVVQEQQKTIDKLNERITQLEKKNKNK